MSDPRTGRRPFPCSTPGRPAAGRATVVGSALLVGLLAGGCGAGTPTPGTLDAPPGVVPNTRGRECRWASAPAETLVLDDLARIGTRGNIALWGREMAPDDTVELSVRYADDARLHWVEAIRSTVPHERIVALEDLVFEALDTRERPDWGVRILIVGGDVARLAPSVICDPRPRSPGAITPNIEARRDFFRVEGHRFPIQIWLDERGGVLNVRLLRRSYSEAIDQFMRDYVWNSNFEPKLHDGIGLESTLDTYIEFPRRRR